MDQAIPDAENLSDFVIFRGCFPPSHTWFNMCEPKLREVGGSFKNLTKICVPKEAQCILSFGPKFMFPTFSLMSPILEDRTWKELLSKLSRSLYYLDYDIPARDHLKHHYKKHTANNELVSKMAWRVMRATTVTADFLQHQQKNAIIVEGDKGKVVGFIYRQHYTELLNKFITTALDTGRYLNISHILL